MTALAALSTVVLAGIVSARARIKAAKGKEKIREETRADADLLRVSYGGIPGTRPGDVGDELVAVQALLDFYHPRLHGG
jgi:hypothetical protein